MATHNIEEVGPRANWILGPGMKPLAGPLAMAAPLPAPGSAPTRKFDDLVTEHRPGRRPSGAVAAEEPTTTSGARGLVSDTPLPGVLVDGLLRASPRSCRPSMGGAADLAVWATALVSRWTGTRRPPGRCPPRSFSRRGDHLAQAAVRQRQRPCGASIQDSRSSPGPCSAWARQRFTGACAAAWTTLPAGLDRRFCGPASARRRPPVSSTSRWNWARYAEPVRLLRRARPDHQAGNRASV